MEKEDKKTRFRIIKDGPIEVTGKFEISDHNGAPLSNESPVYLCRCGASGIKPFCDCAHKKKL